MAELKDYLKEINKCSNCGLCSAACPVFKRTLNQCDCAKGKIAMIMGVLVGKLKMNEKIKSYLKKCEGCDLCTKSCPAGIKIKELFDWFSNRSFN